MRLHDGVVVVGERRDLSPTSAGSMTATRSLGPSLRMNVAIASRTARERWPHTCNRPAECQIPARRLGWPHALRCRGSAPDAAVAPRRRCRRCRIWRKSSIVCGRPSSTISNSSFAKIGDWLALVVRHDDVHADDVDAGAEGGRATLRWRATLRRSGILRAHQRRADEHQNDDDRQSGRVRTVFNRT